MKNKTPFPILICASLVSAQRRRRLFWTNIPNVIQPEDKGILLKDILENGESDRLKSYCIDANYAKGANWKQYIEKGRRQLVIVKDGTEKLKSNTVRSSGRGSGIDDKHNWDTIRIGQIGKGQSGRIYSPEGKSVGLSALGGGRGAKTGLYAVKQVGRRIGEDGHRKDYDYSIKCEQRIEINENPQKTNALSTVQKDNLLLDNIQIRKLTPIEAERLQSLPDNFTEGVSNSQRYKMLGNAFNVDVVSWILSFLQDINNLNKEKLQTK